MGLNLSPKQTRFVDTCVKIKAASFEDVEEAAVICGYNATSVNKLLRSAKIVDALEAVGIRVEPLNTIITPKQHRFIDEYLQDLNVGEAAIRAGYSKESSGSDLMTDPIIRLEIEKRQKKLQEYADISVVKVVLEYAAIAFSDITDFVEWDESGNVKVKDSLDIDGKVVEELSQGQNGLKIKLFSKVKALDAISRHLGLYKERLEITGKDGGDLFDTNPVEFIMGKLNNISKNQSKSADHIEDMERKREEAEAAAKYSAMKASVAATDDK